MNLSSKNLKVPTIVCVNSETDKNICGKFSHTDNIE